MNERFDVIVVGGRCAGAPLAASLASRGLHVCLLDRARFPSDVPSTHLVQPSGVGSLARLGLLERLLATGAPPLERCTFVVDDVRSEAGPEVAERFGTPAMCVRRRTLDSILLDAAREAGADVRTQTAVVGLATEDDVVRGVRTETGTLNAELVVGADGPRSSVARFVGAREYHVTAPGRFFMWAYFENAAEVQGRARLGKVGDTGFLAMPTDAGLFLAGVAPSMAARGAYMADLDGRFAADLGCIEDLTEVLGPATRVGPIRRMTNWRGYFREATGPGWVLVGDAGHFKDPTPGQGISDALRQGEQLAPAIEAGLGDGRLAEHLGRWWRWRDDDAWEMYWFASLLGASGPTPRIAVEMLRSASREADGPEQFLRVLDHSVAPSSLFSPRRGVRALVGTAARHPASLPRLVAEVGGAVRDRARQRRLRRQPVFATEELGVDGDARDAYAQ